MSIFCPSSSQEPGSVFARVRKKRDDYEHYGFSVLQDRTLLAFFDLAQEYETLDNFYRVCVYVPKDFLGFDSCLYLVDPETRELRMACDTLSGLAVCGNPAPEGIHLAQEPYDSTDSFIAPIRGNFRLFSRKPLDYAEDVIGMFEVFSLSRLDAQDRLFFEKYANRIGYSLHYKLIAEQNQRHLTFINTLVADIEHNVIAPNIRYRVFFLRLQKILDQIREISGTWRAAIEAHLDVCDRARDFMPLNERLNSILDSLAKEYEGLEKHYQNTSLFLESLLRREHFTKGELVLQRRKCNFRRRIIDPQLDRYRERLERMGIRIDDHMGGVPDEDIPLFVDIGLISQVYANLFSNAEKYCREVRNERGEYVKFMAYGREVIADFFGPGRPGIKFNVFTTGPHISPEDQAHLFEEGFRGGDTGSVPGTGHGLHFVKKVVEVHGGVVGYEPVYLGNNFYFVLPLLEHVEGEGLPNDHKAECVASPGGI
ncbi:MAG: sensor histidine kinase [Deltaproteobacteria bacterium]